jgi:protocatechuate 3,4-dioxygenase beta subunit
MAALLPAALAGGVSAAPERTLVVHVTDAAGGTGLEGAEVVVWDAERTWAAKTGTDGRARFTDVPAGPVTVYVAAEQHTGTEREEVAVPETGEATAAFALGAGVPFDGTVLDAEEKPAVGADVVVEAGGACEGVVDLQPPEHPPYARTVTDAKGRFHVRGIPPGSVGTLVVRAQGHAEPRMGVRAVGTAVRPAPVEVRLRPGALVRGTVTDPAGKPFAGAAVFVVPALETDLLADPRRVLVAPDRSRTTRAWVAVTDASGAYEIMGLPLDEPVQVAAEGDPHARSAWLAATADVEHREVHGDLRLRRHAILILRVQDAAGTPIADAAVTFESPTLAPAPRLAGLGRLEFKGMWPGEHQVRVVKAGFREARRRVLLTEGGVQEFEVVLEPAAPSGSRLTGTIRDAGGGTRARHGYQVQRPAPSTPTGWTEAASFATTRQGTFDVAVPPGRYRIVFAASRSGTAAVLAADVEVRDGETKKLELVHSG